MDKVVLTYVHYHVDNGDLVRSCCVTQGAQSGALWDGMGEGRETQQGGDRCMSDSSCCTAETNITLQKFKN